MSLNVTANEIQIKNSLGQIKFTSNNKLVYQKAFLTGSIGISSAPVYVPCQALGPNDFLVVTVNIQSGTGSSVAVDSLLQKELPANGSLLIDFYARNESNKAAADSEWLGVDLINGSLKFITNRATWVSPIISSGTTSLFLTYKARIWSFL